MCKDRNGFPKKSYDNYYEAEKNKKYQESIMEYKLYVYHCEYCDKYHLTKTYHDIPEEIKNIKQYLL